MDCIMPLNLRVSAHLDEILLEYHFLLIDLSSH